MTLANAALFPIPLHMRIVTARAAGLFPCQLIWSRLQNCHRETGLYYLKPSAALYRPKRQLLKTSDHVSKGRFVMRSALLASSAWIIPFLDHLTARRFYLRSFLVLSSFILNSVMPWITSSTDSGANVFDCADQSILPVFRSNKLVSSVTT